MTEAQLLAGILRREGGYVDHPADRGGCTKYGITAATLANWRGRQSVTAEDVATLTEDEAKAIYRARYIAPFASVEPEDVRAQVVDIAVNSGISTARALLARAKQGPRAVAVQLVVERAKFYAQIVKGRPEQSVFLVGWLNRCFEFLP